MADTKLQKVAVIHPDLGVGGAERLIVDASLALQDNGHFVEIFTGCYDERRSFEETRDGTLKIITIGQWIPRTILGRLHALMAYLKMIYIAFYLILFKSHHHDLILCDQVSACIPFLKLARYKIVFYCHFPDQLLTKRENLIKFIYRKPIDWFEEWSTSMADIILVNSKFTSSIVKRTFRSLRNRELTVLYPCVNVKSFDKYRMPRSKEAGFDDELNELVSKCGDIARDNYTFLSLNRFERKKNLALAIEALSECLSGFEESNKEGQVMKAHLIVAGGYDERLLDCVQYYEELKGLSNRLDLSHHVTFVKSPSDIEKLALLQMSHAVIYTPENEHFGIVPLEAMAMSKPVVACASGGPLETVDKDVNGLLCEPDKYSFADAMLRLYLEDELGPKMGGAGLERVKRQFSYETFCIRLNEICYPTRASRTGKA